MPLLRLTGLIVATLLVASLSAFVPPSRGPHEILSSQTPAANSAAPATVAAQLPDAAWTRLQGARQRGQYGHELARESGQSVPEAGQ